MADHRPAIKKGIRRRLLVEAGGKCANPGCVNGRPEIHHIMEWHVYGTHDPKDMIAVCPTCHDEIHHGRLGISDETLYEWKKLSRPKRAFHNDQLTPEPASRVQVICGSVALVTNSTELIAFELANSNRMGFRVEDDDMLLVNLRIEDLRGNLVLKVTDNRVRVLKHELVTFERRVGRVLVTAPTSDLFISPTTLAAMRAADPNFAADGRLTILDAQVIAPGAIKVLGVWESQEGAIVITNSGVNIVLPGWDKPGGVGNLIIHLTGPVTPRVFGFPGQGGAFVFSAPRSPVRNG
jgi:hypothetical protein